VSLFAQSVSTPLGPAATRQLKDEGLKHNVPPLGTYIVYAIAMCALTTTMFALEIVRSVLPPAYWGAERVVPFVVLGAVFQGFYFVESTGTWFSMKTRLVPVITATGAIVNVGINIVFVPRYGIMAAAVATAVGYGAMAVLHGWLAHRVHRIPWEYRRWAGVCAIALGAYAAGRWVPFSSSTVAVAVKALLIGVAIAVGGAVAGIRRLRK
jgi:O-antigen/teichoic acid export membrane protein